MKAEKFSLRKIMMGYNNNNNTNTNNNNNKDKMHFITYEYVEVNRNFLHATISL